LVATGSELREPGERLAAGQIYESNRVALGALAEQAGARTKVFPIVPDDPAKTEELLRQALGECDVVVSAGGVSVGEFDFVKGAIERLGGELEFWKVAIKPGKPFVFGSYRGKLLFGVPGNPVSAFVTFVLLVRAALLRLQGGRDVALPSDLGVLTESISNRGDRRHFVRVRSDPQGAVRQAGVQASHVLSCLGQANGLVDVPPETVLKVGESVRVLRWQ
jgi:molybdopterin molybdotransferase